MNIDFEKHDEELLGLSFVSKHMRDVRYLKRVIKELAETREEYIEQNGADAKVTRLQEVILNYIICLKESTGEDYTPEKKSLEYILTLSY